MYTRKKICNKYILKVGYTGEHNSKRVFLYMLFFINRCVNYIKRTMNSTYTQRCVDNKNKEERTSLEITHGQTSFVLSINYLHISDSKKNAFQNLVFLEITSINYFFSNNSYRIINEYFNFNGVTFISRTCDAPRCSIA